MKILAMSDTHGRLDIAEEVILKNSDVDLIVHLGDMSADGEKLSDKTGRKIICVPGNCDGVYDEEGFRILETDFGSIYIAHGHMENVKAGTMNIKYKALEKGCKAALYGHTHIPVFECDEVHLINPGSLGLPGPGKKPSYAIIDLEKDKLSCEIVYCEKISIMNKKNAPVGSISRMLNYSDRF